MESIGERLKKTRESKKLSLAEVSKKTTINLDILTALEEDRFNILNKVYIKGFLKIYSSFLGLDPQKIIEDYNSFISPKDSHAEAIAKKAAVDKIRYNSRNYSVFIYRLIVVIAIFLLFSFISRHKKNVPSLNRKGATIERSSIESKKKEAAARPKSNVVSKPVEVGPVRLGLHAKDNCWVKVRLDGKVMFQGILTKGQNESWQAKEKIEVSLSNAAAIELEANNKILSPLGRRKEAIKSIVITRQGVTINR
ncbi:MAG: RodZ domain-containing protein [Candidatus Omnitrophota bacterium]